jgi:hypothetical protein
VKAAADKAERAIAGREGREAAVTAAAAERAAAEAAAGAATRARSNSRSRSRSSSREPPDAGKAGAAAAGSRGDGLYEMKEKTGAGRCDIQPWLVFDLLDWLRVFAHAASASQTLPVAVVAC